MAGLLALAALFAATIVACDLVRAPWTLQAALGRVALVHGAGLTVSLVLLVATGRLRVVPIVIFWSGAALAWFGIRSHLESSLFLRLIQMLYASHMTRDDLVACYSAGYGETQRVAELVHGGLLRPDTNGVSRVLTSRGRRVVRIALRLL